jgi:hypothetical protein
LELATEALRADATPETFRRSHATRLAEETICNRKAMTQSKFQLELIPDHEGNWVEVWPTYYPERRNTAA